MANEVIGALTAQVAENTKVEASAALLINGISTRVQEAVDKAIANGASAEELAPVKDLVTALNQSQTDLAAAVAANTPQPA